MAVETPAWYDSPFLKAARREPVERTPIWLMRQAGRYLPEYRALREKYSFLELCRKPELAAEITISTVARFGFDAAILFADLLPILKPMGFELRFGPGEGPVIRNHLGGPKDVDRVQELGEDRLAELDFVFEAIRLAREGLPKTIPLIGFAGAPFTLAAYAIEGGTTRSFERTKCFMIEDSGAWRELMERMARSIARYVKKQVTAGVQAIQIFDSWAGCLSPKHYQQFVLPYTQIVFEAIPADVPAIHFLTGNPMLLPLQAKAGGTVIGVDWRIDIGDAWDMVGDGYAIQGNLDPVVLCGPEELVVHEARAILQRVRGRPGHIFNLGHGVLPSTPVSNVSLLVQTVHEWNPRQIS
ncbi:MAG TPA: uroporphyrinogen decarboxylase [Thermogutta sp.]|nr:uroporphyrinogen decarboxylase [Thermogutta sp.]